MTGPVPLLDLKAQFHGLREAMGAALLRVLESQVFIIGPEVEALEREVAAYCGARHAVGLSSGTDALLAGLMALGVGPGDEVVTSPFTFFATAGSIWRLGARPVFVDIRPDTFNLDESRVADALTDRTRALMPVHIFGQCCDMDALSALARERDLPILEDAAQAIGATWKGARAGALGTIGAFSFFPSKNLGGLGDGGMATTDSDSLAAALRQIRMHGQSGTYIHESVGGNFRLDALQAAGLRVKLPHLDLWAKGRAENAAWYTRRLAEEGLEEFLVAPPVHPSAGHVFNQFTLRAKNRDGLREALKAAGIGHAVYYPLPLHLQPCFAALGHKPGDFPAAEKASRAVISLPVYPELTEEQKERVVAALKGFYLR